jgi:hypothetical protein
MPSHPIDLDRFEQTAMIATSPSDLRRNRFPTRGDQMPQLVAMLRKSL